MRKIRKFYTQRVLPLVYDYSLSQYEVMNKLTDVVNTLAEDDEEYDHRIDTCEHNIEVLSDRVDVANRGVDNLGERVTDIENELENIPTDDRIEELQQGINQNSADIADLDNRVEVLENMPDLSSQVSVNTADISDIKGDIRDINNGLDSHARRISDCEDDISDLQTAVNGKSTVSYNQIITTGNKIGEITINGNTTDIYSPTAPTPTTPTAVDVTYDNTTSGLSASNVQDAIDEIDSTLDNTSSTASQAYAQALQNLSDIRILSGKVTTNENDIRDLKVYLNTDVNYLFYDYNIAPHGSFDIPINGQPLSGFLTSSGKLIRVAVPYRKILKGALSDYSSSFIFDLTGNVEIRGVSGYVIPTAQAYGNISVSVSLFETEMRLDITKSDSTAFNANLNNTPVSVIFYGSGSKIKITARG